MFDLGQYLQSLCFDVSNHVADIAAADTEQTKRKKFLLLLATLRTWSSEVNPLLLSSVRESIVFSHDRLLSNLPEDVHGQAALNPTAKTKIVQTVHGVAFGRLLKVISGIRALADQVRQGTYNVVRSIIGTRVRADVLHDAAAREALAKKLIAVRGSDGRTRRYEPQNYGELVQDETQAGASRGVANKVADQLGSDLMMVNNKPSTIGDACTALAGLVYSRSGTDPRVFPQSLLPGGQAPPWHPRCHHYAVPLIAANYTDAELRAMSRLPPALVDVLLRGGDFNDLNRVWLQKAPTEWLGKQQVGV